ncbi:MAG TPA: GAF domain-containing protein [Nocardioides sp.]|nr:GAF domain-containing protein [Nocardioides sp.]
MTPLGPIPETVEAVNNLDASVDEGDLLGDLARLADLGRDVVPDLVGVSIARLDHGLTFTLVASSEEIAVLDAVQYVAGGPCVDGAHLVEVLQFDNSNVLDEERWRLFAEATAARAVRSTLTLPVVGDNRVVGTVNLYAASRHAFVGHHEELADVFGAWAGGAVGNADMSFTTLASAQAAPRQVRDQHVIDVATGLLAAELRVDVEAAAARLRDAASRAGVSRLDLAREIVAVRDKRRREW